MKGSNVEMEIKRDALVRVVKAARLSLKMADAMQLFMIDKRPWTVADEISGHLKDALFIILGEHALHEKSFDESMTMRLLTSDMSDGAVADYIIMMQNIQKHIEPELAAPNIVQQPKPQIMSKEEFRKLKDQNGGYCYTPEGEWK